MDFRLVKEAWLRSVEGFLDKPGWSAGEWAACEVVSLPSRSEFREWLENSLEGFPSWDAVRRDDREGLLGGRGPGILGVRNSRTPGMGEQEGVGTASSSLPVFGEQRARCSPLALSCQVCPSCFLQRFQVSSDSSCRILSLAPLVNPTRASTDLCDMVWKGRDTKDLRPCPLQVSAHAPS